MRIAWFRATLPDARDPLDDTAALVDELRRAHAVDVVTEREAHDFVWQHFLRPWDVCVYEVDAGDAHAFVWAYLINYPGVAMLRSTNIAHLRVPLFASRCVVTSSRAAAELLRARYPEAEVRTAPTGTVAPAMSKGHSGPVRFAIFDSRTRDAQVIARAVQRARDAGASFELLDPQPNLLATADVVIAPGWPPSQQMPAALLAGMAAGKTVVTMEMDADAEWPAMDPQTWRPRGLASADAPIAVTIDPRDEEHSLMLAIRRLAADAPLREQLGRAARAWWAAHATPAHAAAAWTPILEDAVRLSPPARPRDWPKQFSEDGTGLTRGILSELGVPPTDILARS